ncbi:hypothetical protein C2869_15715 [Saccharobesus litoralis]|uniref:DUF115 domain-containing protein n=1 Tax=Saccharobesus litoralis TaxID=2172099 RepID=A0A2S0VUE0_9ALTE|nr:6-hydroxymethylpterin diphosphokinase MptE-like protein [Saccharobesus litoralis]AWB67782.1 hypothetical protein C2869_15715 [Saccharobesus litoralis]
MLKNIRLHVETDEEKQNKIESELSHEIERIYKNNLVAFQQHAPSMEPYVKNLKASNIAIFCNKNGDHNIVDFGAGRTFYGLSPKQEIEQQFLLNTQHMQYIDFALNPELENITNIPRNSLSLSDLPSFQHRYQLNKAPKNITTLVVLGLGLGQHISKLIDSYDIDYLVIYEPELQYFQCSVMSENWRYILDRAQQKKTQLFFQIGKDGRDIIADMNELVEHCGIQGFYLFKHYNHPVFNAIELNCQQKSWRKIKETGINFHLHQKAVEYLPKWTVGLDLQHYSSLDKNNEKFIKNLEAFKTYFPNIYQEFNNYEPQVWLPVKSPKNEINVIKKDCLTPWYGEHPVEESLINFDNYTKQPTKDGLVLGYEGQKLKHYLHYQFVSKTTKLLNEAEEQSGKLPGQLKSLIFFGMGVGYQMESLFDNHQVDKLFLCEPNRDFFFASLFAIDWAHILKKVDETQSRLYINIGDDGSNLFQDLLKQFYSIGPYVLASTYFYQSYYNSELTSAIAQLREQLQIVVSMGEYFDHARYGIAHTTNIIERGTALLVNNPSRYLSFEDTEVPIFLVGNGPSLDTAIETIKEWKDQAIIISCGTALMPLYKHGIVPDFHAEIEQNRATFDWCCRVGDFEYLKKISLISCNGIHPDTCDLFKDTFVAFKDGESSTASALEILGKENYTELKFAFPTVSNMVLNIFSTIGFNQIYLFGVDLGFVDVDNHHSKLSGYYYTDGKEISDYKKDNNTSIVVPGNFRNTVLTKHEFKLSKTLMEQLLRKRRIDCFNCSDGARIEGAKPLKLELLLVTSSSVNKKHAIGAIKDKVFRTATNYSKYSEMFSNKYDYQVLESELIELLQLAKQEFNSIKQVEDYINKQKELLFKSYKRGASLLFYLMYGTVNYTNALLSKLLTSKENENCQLLNSARKHWVNTLDKLFDNVKYYSDLFDLSDSFVHHREISVAFSDKSEKVINICETHKAIDNFWRSSGVITPDNWLPTIGNTYDVPDYPKYAQLKESMKFYPKLTSEQLSKEELRADYTVDAYLAWITEDNLLKKYMEFEHKASIVIGTNRLEFYKDIDSHICFYWSPGEIDDLSKLESLKLGKYPMHNRTVVGFNMMKALLVSNSFSHVISKLNYLESSLDKNDEVITTLFKEMEGVRHFVEFSSYIAIPRSPISDVSFVDALGNRGKVFNAAVKLEQLYINNLTRDAVNDFCSTLKF